MRRHYGGMDTETATSGENVFALQLARTLLLLIRQHGSALVLLGS